MRALRIVKPKPRQLGNMRQLETTKTEISASNHLTITQHITPDNLQAMHNHYATILKAIETAQALEHQRKLNEIKTNEYVEQAKKDYERKCIALARIVKKRCLSIASAKRIAQSNHTIGRDMAAHGRKLSRIIKKHAIYKLYLSGITQKRICAMLGYKPPYVSKIVKCEKENAQPFLF